jgi:LacI family transcriptional regulator
MRVTIKKIAEVAKVSPGTVDKVLNNRIGVSDEVRKKVREIAEAMNYRPNMIGKALANQKKPINIGVILAPDYNPFVEDVKKGVESASRELYDFGIRIDLQVLGSLDAEEQLSIINGLLKRNVSAISLVPIESEAIRNGINNMVDNGIPVVTFNSDIKETKRLCFVGQDHIQGGMVAGELMGKTLNRRGKVSIITSSQKLLCHKQRIAGFQKMMAKQYSAIEILEVVENQDQESLAFELALTQLQENSDLKGIYITGGGVSGIGKALKLLDKGGDIKVVSHDFVPGTINLLKEGIIDFTIGQDPFSQGYLPIKILYEYLLAGKVPEKEHIQTKIDIRIQSNIDVN